MSNVVGLEALNFSEQKAVVSGGQFSLPSSCDGDKWAYKWVEEGPQVQEAQQPTMLVFAGVKAQGWAVHKVAKVGVKGEDGKTAMPALEPYKRAVGKRVFVLMQRPKDLQTAVNRIYANQSRNMVVDELEGNTISAGSEGLISAAVLKKYDKTPEMEMSKSYLTGVDFKHPDEAVEIKLA